MKDEIQARLGALRRLMEDKGVSAAIIPHTDPHQSEYLASHWHVRRFLSGFTGSAGTLVVTVDKALLWTDSRYFLQAADQLADTGILLMKDGIAGTPSIGQYLVDNLPKGSIVGVDGMLYSLTQAQQLETLLQDHGLKLDTNFDVIDQIWTNRPPLPKGLVFIHDETYAGESAKSKLQKVLADAKFQGAKSAFICPLDEIAWTLNIRCNDVKYNPVATAYLYVQEDVSVLFVDPQKIEYSVLGYLESQGVTIQPYDSVKDFLANLPTSSKVLIEASRTSVTLADLLGERAVCGNSPVAVAKACKNETEIDGFRAAMVRDGVALVKAFKEIEEIVARGEKLSELDVDALLLKYRKERELFYDESFGSIIGYGPHGAIVHYEPTVESNAEIQPDGLLLVDSGAQYLDGTTDITRTISMGNPTAEQKHDFTLVLKGTIALAMAVFPVDTRGAQLDVLARQYLWREGKAYLHGTGHGIGHFLNVHEGPQTIRLNNTPIPLMVGMVTSDEPGLYIEGKYGIRCENLILCIKDKTTEFGEFLKFETLTLFPFDLSLLDMEIMTPEEIAWLNDYHQKVYDALSPNLSSDECAWLKQKTQKII